MTGLNVWTNPICIQHARTRLRPIPTVSWGLVTLTCVAFIFALTYLSLTERGEIDPVEAAKTALVPLIVVQCVLLMGMGTSAVATGIARERERELLDYHRMSPMTPPAKIIGYLFGLPSREYFLFALTLPFVAYAVLRGGIPLLKVAHFYVAFFSSVWLYHMTGLMAGMVSRKPWQSSFVSLGLVASLYLVLPLFAQVGLSFFDFLTVRPTFYGMVAEELHNADHSDWVPRNGLIKQYESVPFFNLWLNPTLFSLVVQIFVLITMYHVVRRKWVDISWHPFSKAFSLFFVAGVLTLLVGSLSPLVSNAQVHKELNERIGVEGTPGLSLFVGLFFVISALTLLMTISLTTPTRHAIRRGLRRARKGGFKRVPLMWDAATTWPTTAAMLLLGLLGFGLVVWTVQSGEVYQIEPGMGRWLVALVVLGVLVVVAFQGMHERFGQRSVIFGLFVCWGVPMMVGTVMLAAFEAWRPAMYIGAFCPAVGSALSLTLMIDAAGELEEFDGYLLYDTPAEEHARLVIALTLMLYAGLAVLGQVLRYQAARRLRRIEVSASSDDVIPPTPRQPDPLSQAAG